MEKVRDCSVTFGAVRASSCALGTGHWSDLDLRARGEALLLLTAVDSIISVERCVFTFSLL